MAYIFIAVYLIVGNWLFFQNFYVIGQSSMRSYFSLLPWIFLFIVPALTMRIWSEEKKSGTIESLLTLPIKDGELILAKFLSSLAFFVIVLVLTISIPISIAQIGNMDTGATIGGYIGAVFLGAAYLAIGLYISSITKNQIIAFILTLAITFILFIISTPFVLSAVPTFVAAIFRFMGLGSHFSNLSKGIIDSRDILYYLSIIIFFIYLNARSLASRNWK